MKFSGLHEELPDQDSPEPGKAEWIFTFGGRHAPWKPGAYTLQLDTPDKDLTTTFEVIPAKGEAAAGAPR